MRAAGPLVLRFKDEADGIFAPNESSATGMAEVLKSQGHNKKIMVMGFDASKPLLDMIRDRPPVHERVSLAPLVASAAASVTRPQGCSSPWTGWRRSRSTGTRRSYARCS